MLKHPHHKLSLKVGTAPEIEALVEQHELDCGIIMKGKGTSSPNLIWKSFPQTKLYSPFQRVILSIEETHFQSMNCSMKKY